jgi:hypothetical protein
MWMMGLLPMFQGHMLPPSSALTRRTHFDPEGGGSMYFRNVGKSAQIHTVQTPKRRINIISQWSRKLRILHYEMRKYKKKILKKTPWLESAGANYTKQDLIKMERSGDERIQI